MNLNYEPSRKFALDFYESMPTRTRNPSIVDYSEKTIIPAGKYRGLNFKHNRAPFLKEPLSLLSPDSSCRIIVVMFPAQTGKSTLAELATMYYITQVPSEILYVSSNETAAIKWLERRIVPRAAADGVQFKTEVETRASRKTGDTTYSKLFPGGNIDIASALSPAQLASETKRIVLADETDRWRVQLGDEGSVWDMIQARTQAWGSQSKILAISTPTTEDASLINQLYLQGDKRLYYVPCPFCGFMQLLDFSHGRAFGLNWEYKDGHINRKSIIYVCESGSCQKEIRESSKSKILNGGEWRKSAIAEYDFMSSFHLNGLYSPMLSWYDMVVSYHEAQMGHIKKQAHENLKMGRPFRESGSRPKVEKIIENRGKYKSGQVPDGVLYLTAGIDVQEGSKKNELNPARLEMEILGIGAGYKTWSICYEVFKGEILDPYSGAWELLNQYALETELRFYRDDGFGFPISLIFIDSGSGKVADIVYRFCSRWQNTFPIKGFSALTRRKKEKGDEITAGNFRRYRPQKISGDVTLYEISTNYYKTQIYHNLKISRQDLDPQRPGFCDFPRDYGERYFEMLTSEERRRDGSFHNPGGRRNESLDVRVYALCAGDVFLDSELLNYRAWSKENGAHPSDVLRITHKTVIETMTKQTLRRNIEKSKKN